MVTVVDSNSVEVLYDGIYSDDEEEEGIAIMESALVSLETFEYSNEDFGVEELRKQGAILAKMRDFGAGIRILEKASRKISGVVSVGANIVLVDMTFDDRGVMQDPMMGTIGTIEEDMSSIELMIDEDLVVPLKDKAMVPVPCHGSQSLVLISICSEIAKFALKIEPCIPAITVKYTAVIIAICNCILSKQEHIDWDDGMTDGRRIVDILFNATVLKSRAHILQSRLKQASIDIKRAVMLKPADAGARQMVSPQLSCVPDSPLVFTG